MNDTVLPNLNDVQIPVDETEKEFLSNITSNNVTISSVTTNDNIELQSSDNPYSLSLKIYEFENEKELFKFVNNVKKMVRGSYEYKLWTSYLKDTLQYNRCVLSNESGHELTIEIHHHPISMQNIILAIVNTYISKEKSFCTFDIASEVMDLHYQMKVGVIPLITSLHEKFHNGFLNLPIDLVIGDWKYLLETYDFSEDQLDTIRKYEEYTSHNCEFFTTVKMNKTTDEEAV